MFVRLADNYCVAVDFLQANGVEFDGEEFYRYIFPCNELRGVHNSDFSCPNAIYLYQAENISKDCRRFCRRIMLQDTWGDDYVDFVEKNPMTLCSGLSYRGKVNTLNNAQQMNALIFDLDNVGLKELRNLFLRFGQDPRCIRTLPVPTFVVASGNGLHLYYVFDEPIALYPNIKVQLKNLKYDLTFRIWEYKATSQAKQIQYQSINQCFRMVGSVNSKYGTVLRAFQIGDRVSLDYLNQYADIKNRVDFNKPFRPSKMTRQEAQEKYPDWYQRVVIEKNRNQRKWDIKGKVHGENPYALYDWWKRKSGQVKGGHRYFFLMCMAIYACKCDVPKKKLKADMKELFHELKKIEHDNELKQEDIISALEAYDKEYYNFTICDISKLTDIPIEKNRRNGRKQVVHLQGARAIQEINDKANGTYWRDGNGRPKGSGTAEQKVREWKAVHPHGKKSDCIRDTGLSKPTVYKWWEEPISKTVEYQEEQRERIPDYILNDPEMQVNRRYPAPRVY